MFSSLRKLRKNEVPADKFVSAHDLGMQNPSDEMKFCDFSLSRMHMDELFLPSSHEHKVTGEVCE